VSTIACVSHHGESKVYADRRVAVAAWALLAANARYWTTVAPKVRGELAGWRARAMRIEEPGLRKLALRCLREEGFTAEVAATLATLTPSRCRAAALRAMVALEVMYDYLDALTELPATDPLANGRLLFKAFTDALDPEAKPDEDYYRHHAAGGDGGYLHELGASVREALRTLPTAEVLGPAMRRAGARCAQAEVLTHLDTLTGGAQAEAWAKQSANGSGMEWREYLAGAASSVLAVHALIALAGDEHTTVEQAGAIDGVYFTLGVLSTMLDSVVDYERDAAEGTLAYINHYDDRAQLGMRLAMVIREVARRAQIAPASAHHLMTLTGVAAYYISAPSARSELALPVTSRVQRELQPLITPTLALMRSWRLAKRLGMRVHGDSPTSGRP
jgi:tetraprenyl-beta-curcumene synthase